MTETLFGIVGSLLGALLVLAVQEMIGRARSRKGVFSGEWEELILAQHGEAEKHDQVTCKHVGNTVSGSIRRQHPTDQTHKNWRFQGHVRGSLIFVTFWATDAAKNPGSYGTIQLHMINEKQLKGFYVKLIVTASQDKFTGELKQVHVEWLRRN